MLIQFLRFFFANFRITGAIVIGGAFGLIVGLFLFGTSFPLLLLICVVIPIALLLTDPWWHGLFKK